MAEPTVDHRDHRERARSLVTSAILELAGALDKDIRMDTDHEMGLGVLLSGLSTVVYFHALANTGSAANRHPE